MGVSVAIAPCFWTASSRSRFVTHGDLAAISPFLPESHLWGGISDAILSDVSKFSLSIVCGFLVGCAGASAPVQESAQPVAVQAQEAPKPVAPEPALIEPPAAESAYDSNPCSGTDLDLGSLAAQSMCNLDRTAEPFPKGLVASLSTESLSIIEGSASDIRLVLTNTTDKPVTAEFDASCRFVNMIELAIYKRTSRLDRVSMQCDVESKGDCAGHVVAVTIDAGGEAFVSIGVPARVALLSDKDCTEYPSRVLSPGSYSMRIRNAFTKTPLRAKLTIKRLVLLPRKRCTSYAKKVTEVAEPNASLRPGVASSLATQCKRKQPSQEFADCQLAATTTETLKACTTLK